MSSSRSMTGSNLESSWVVNDLDSSDANLDEADAPPLSPRKRQPLKKILGPASTKHGATRRRSSRSSSTVPEPELIMPSIHENMDGSWAGQDGSESAHPRARARKTKSTKARNAELANKAIPKPMRVAQPQNKSSEIGPYLLNLLSHTGEWLLDIAGGTLKALKKPITWVLTIYVFAGLFTVVQNFIFKSMYTALTPLCRIPGVSFLDLPMCQSRNDLPSIDPHAHAEFDKLITVQSQFEDLMDQSAAGVSLPMDMKRSETSVRDLRQVVKWSTLHSKNELVFEFDGIIDTARIASYDLQKFNAHVGRAVDMVLSSTRWTQRVLDDMAVTQSSSRSILPAFINNKILAPFQPLQFNEDRLLDQYLKHTNAVSGEIERLLGEAQGLLLTLQNLEDRLDVIHGIALRDNIHAQGSKDEVLSQLWTLLGGNRAKLGRFNEQLRLLRQVGEQRKIAWAHVSSAILKLQAMGAQLEELRERVGSADLLKDHPEVPLAVHLETIRLGVERLEQGRIAARELERGHIRRTLDSAEKDERTFVLDGESPRIGR